MRTILFTALLILSSNFIVGQRMSDVINMQWQDMIWDIPGDPVLINAFESTEGYIVFKKHPIRGPGGYKYYIETLDKDLKRVDFKDISDAIDEKNHYVEEVFQFAGKILIITSSDFRDLSKQEFYIQEVDWVNGTVGRKQLVYEYNYTGRRSDLDLHKRISPNGEYMLLSYAPRNVYNRKEGKQADKRSFVVYNADMDVVDRQDEINMEYSGNIYSVKHTIVSDKGAIYLLADKIIEERGEEDLKSILKFQDGELVANIINFNEGKLLDMLISMNPDGTLYCGGYYSEDIGRGSGQGVVVMNVDPETGEPINISTQLIGKELLVEGLSDKEKIRLDKREDAGKEVKQTRDITIREVVSHENGTSSLIGEMYVLVISSSTDANGHTTTTYTYYYDELFVTRIGKDGEILSTVKMPKRYKGSHDLKVSYHAFDMNNELAIVFNDNRNNLIEIGPKGVLPYTRKAKVTALTIVTIDESGNQKREGLIDYAMKPYSAYRQYYLWRDLVAFNNRMLFMTYYGSKQFGYMLATPR